MPVVAAVAIFPSMSPTPPTIPIAPAINTTPTITNNVYFGNHEKIDNVNISNEYDYKGETKEDDDFDLLVKDVHNANEVNIRKNEMLSPSTKNRNC